MSLVFYKHNVESRSRARVQGAAVYVVPYVVGRTTSSECSYTDAVTVYSDENGSSPVQMMTTDENGQACFYIEEGEYAICTKKGDSSHTDPHICIYSQKDDSDEVDEEVETYSETINVNPTFKHTIVHGLNCSDYELEVVDADGKPVYPTCETIDENTICLAYSDSCPVSVHEVTIKCVTKQEEVIMSGGAQAVAATIDIDALICKYEALCKLAMEMASGQSSLSFKINGSEVVAGGEDGKCFDFKFNNAAFGGIALKYDDDGLPLLPTIKIDGVAGTYDATNHCINFTSSKLNLVDGGSGLINVNGDTTTIGPLINCDNEVIEASAGSIQSCARVPVCGYTGDAICEDIVLGESYGTEQQTAIPFSGGELEGIFILTQSGPNGVMTVGTPTVSGSVVSVPVQLSSNAKVGYNVLVDKTNLTSVEGCTAPVSGFIEINGLQGDVGGSQITKSVGGTVTVETNLSAVAGNVYETINNAASAWRDEVGAHLFGSDPSNYVGSTETGEVQVFDDSTQNIVISFEACYYLPAVSYTDLDGVWIEGMDSNGDEITEGEFQSLTV